MNLKNDLYEQVISDEIKRALKSDAGRLGRLRGLRSRKLMLYWLSI